MLVKEAWSIVGGLSNCSKMPCYSWGTPASLCNVGGVLAKVKESVCHVCYALKGRFLFKNVREAQERRLKAYNHLWQHDEWVKAMSFLINHYKKPFRWFDSGDIQSLAQLINIVRVANRTPKVQHWLPTKEKATVMKFLNVFGKFPSNLNVQMSGYMVDGPRCNMSKHDDKVSHHLIYTKTAPTGSYVCPVGVKDSQFKSCSEAECYACWDKSVPVVAGRLH
jgi:hypothetical protein